MSHNFHLVMTSPAKPWETGNNLQNSSQVIRNQNVATQSLSPGSVRPAPVLPPRPMNSLAAGGLSTPYNSYMPYSGIGGTGYNSYGSYGLPYRSSLYNSYGSYGSYGGSYGGYNNYGMYGNAAYPSYDDHERRFVQFAEASSRSTFASVESVVRAFSSLAMMLDNTFFAMTSSFRAVLSVAENFGRLRSVFGQIWYSVNIFRFFNWVYRRLRQMLGLKVPQSASSLAWREAAGSTASGGGTPPSSSWPTIAFLGVLMSAPYIISRLLPKYQDKTDPANWKSPGVQAKACFDFIGSSPNELTIHMNDIVTLAPQHVQEELNLKNSGWAFALCNGKSGVVPLNYLVISKTKPILTDKLHNNSVPVPSKNEPQLTSKTHCKRVSFGENQIFENVDLDDYDIKRDEPSCSQSKVTKCNESYLSSEKDNGQALNESEQSST